MENQMEISVALTCSGVEMEVINSEMESWTWLGGSHHRPKQKNKIAVLEQEIVDLKSQLQNAKRQMANFMEKQFTL